MSCLVSNEGIDCVRIVPAISMAHVLGEIVCWARANVQVSNDVMGKNTESGKGWGGLGLGTTPRPTTFKSRREKRETVTPFGEARGDFGEDVTAPAKRASAM